MSDITMDTKGVCTIPSMSFPSHPLEHTAWTLCQGLLSVVLLNTATTGTVWHLESCPEMQRAEASDSLTCVCWSDVSWKQCQDIKTIQTALSIHLVFGWIKNVSISFMKHLCQTTVTSARVGFSNALIQVSWSHRTRVTMTTRLTLSLPYFFNVKPRVMKQVAHIGSAILPTFCAKSVKFVKLIKNICIYLNYHAGALWPCVSTWLLMILAVSKCLAIHDPLCWL